MKRTQLGHDRTQYGSSVATWSNAADRRTIMILGHEATGIHRRLST